VILPQNPQSTLLTTVRNAYQHSPKAPKIIAQSFATPSILKSKSTGNVSNF
jgi:hypothetical protein